MQKRGQITLFVIIGILLVIVVAIVLSARNLTEQARLDAEADNLIEEFVQTSALHHYVSSCLDKVTSEGIVLLSQQGGVIYESQGGLTPDKTQNTDADQSFKQGVHYYPFTYTTLERGNLVEKQFNISYGIRDYADCPIALPPRPINLSNEETSYYPIKDTFFTAYTTRYANNFFDSLPGCNLLSREISWSGFLGKNNMPPLCSYDGPNKNTLVCNSLYGFDSMAKNNSLERQLQTFVEYELPVCVNFTMYENILGSNITVIDEPNVSIYFQQPRGMQVIASYPFIVRVQGKEPIIRQFDFQKKFSININEFYNFIYILVKNMVRNPYFDVREEWDNPDFNPFYYPFYDVNVLPSELDCDIEGSVCLDQVLRVTDTSSQVLGKPLTFNFAIQQRKPALDYLHWPRTPPTIINENVVNFQHQIGDRVTIPIDFIDPDGSEVTVQLTGWKADANDMFNETCCDELDDGCALANHWQCVVRDNDPPEDFVNQWKDFNAEATSQTWYDTTDEDIGLHNVTVIVTDAHGLKDFQIVRILVFDLPVAVLELRNLFDDINNSYASIEDPYILNASNSQPALLRDDDSLVYTFIDNKDGKIITTSNNVLSLPIQEDITIHNVTAVWFSAENFSGNVIEKRQVSLAVSQEGLTSDPDVKTIHLAACLPHGYKGTISNEAISKNDYESLPYPYYSGEEYQASHVCCVVENPLSQDNIPSGGLRGGDYADSSMVCYEKDFKITYPYQDYTLLQTAILDKDKTVVDVNKTSYGNKFLADAYGGKDFTHSPSDISFSDNRMNNFFSVNFKQFCSAQRGNTCGGTINTEWIETECTDFTPALENQFARCAGPSIVGFNKEEENLVCRDYSSTTFEKQLYDSFNDDSELEPAFKEFYDKKYDKDVFEYIQKGYCAGPQGGNLQDNGVIAPQPSAGDFSCMGVCKSGACGLSDLSACTCDGNPVCKDFTAADFVTDQGSLQDYRCVENTACLSNCQIAPQNSQAACECRNGIYMAGNCCETGSSNIFIIPDGTRACFQGEVLEENNLVQTPYGEALLCGNSLLFCDDYLGPYNTYVQTVTTSTTKKYCSHTCLPSTREWD
ncbi:hypothetical protein K9M74_02555 [Candidatus Woesearchaeota archaeon]|nr:hypothetical protein [Candidatus Woesearchaeota archaeon]